MRTASTLVLLPAAIACVWLGGIAWLVLLGLCGVLALAEWLGMARAGRLDGTLVMAGFVYLALALACLWWLREDPLVGRANLLFLLVVVWASDIGAYLAGRWLGGPRLAPAISPGKTWSGALGGLAAAALAGVLAALAWPHGALAAAMVLAVLLAAVSQLGDLLESWAKRRCAVKDSGRLIPGHGGLLDRVDGILAAAPAMTLLGLWLGKGVVLWN